MAKISKTTVDKMKPGDVLRDEGIPGFQARRLPSGVTTYGFRFRIGTERPMMSLGAHSEAFTAEQARVLARKYSGMVAAGINPAAARDAAREKAVIDKTKTVDAVLDNYTKRCLEGRLASAPIIISVFKRLVRPVIGTKIIYDLTRGDIIKMLDGIEDDTGAVMAHNTLAYLRTAFNWQQVQDEKFISPIVKGMSGDRKSTARDRFLSDDEIADVWAAQERLSNSHPTVAQFVRLLLLTAQRRSEVAEWHSDQVKDMGTSWEFEAREYKGRHFHSIPITDAMRAQLVRRSGYMVSMTDGRTAFSTFGTAKRMLDQKIAEVRKARGAKPMPAWTFHDLRRTARSIMSRYTTPDVAERVIGHALVGVRATYDRHGYMDEKLDALNKLAEHVLAVAHGKVAPVLRSRAAA